LHKINGRNEIRNFRIYSSLNPKKHVRSFPQYMYNQFSKMIKKEHEWFLLTQSGKKSIFKEDCK
jgi:hypothetical protein